MNKYYQILVKPLSGSSILLRLEEEELGDFVAILEVRMGLLLSAYRLLNSCGREISEEYLRSGMMHPCTVFINGILLGGKGGFGANLRRQGGRMGAKKTTNFDACRDLNGRRLKTVKNTQRMAEYIASSDQRHREEEEKIRRKIMDGLRGLSKRNKIEDSNFVKESKEMVETIVESVEEGIAAANKVQIRHDENEKQYVTKMNRKRPLVFWEDSDGFVDEDETEKEHEMEAYIKPASSSIRIS